MNITLTEAPVGKSLLMIKVLETDLRLRLERMGLFEGSEITRLDQEVLIQPIRVRGPQGDAVLGGGMTMKIVVHLDDGRKLPLAEMKPDEAGHIEGLTGGRRLESALETLGLKMNDHIRMLRRLPPMEYVAVIESQGRVRLTEGMAVKIWGRMHGKSLQFVSSRAGERFHVEQILGGANACQMLGSRGIEPGKILILEGVAPAQNLRMGVRNPVVITSAEGLRLFLNLSDAEQILVQQIATKENRE